MVRQRFNEEEIKIEVRNHPVPSMNQTISSIISLLKFAFIGCVLMNYDPSESLGISTPHMLVWAWENKGYACMMAFFLGNAIESGLTSTGAFEIYLNSEQLWSKLSTGRVPNQGEFLNMLEQTRNLMGGQSMDNEFASFERNL